MTAKRKEAIVGLREVLIKRRDALRRALAGDMAGLQMVQSGHGNGDMVDGAMNSTQHDVSSQLVQVESRELEHIESALERMRFGNFGNCAQCQIEIPMVRLNALPYAFNCVSCQRKLDS